MLFVVVGCSCFFVDVLFVVCLWFGCRSLLVFVVRCCLWFVGWCVLVCCALLFVTVNCYSCLLLMCCLTSVVWLWLLVFVGL